MIALVAELRAGLEAAGQPQAARWLHRGLTSQDVVDTALVLCARDAVAALTDRLRAAATWAAALADVHRGTVMAGRTLTQHAVPTTFGLEAAAWLSALLDAVQGAEQLRWPVQAGGAAGTRAAYVELAGRGGATTLVAGLAERLRLEPRTPWHTTRAPLTRIGDAAVGATDACGRIARDVLVRSRPEIGELAEAAGGGSSTMPHKANPVLSTLVRSAALRAPQLAATLHVAAADHVDERADGAWHAEWPALAELLRTAVVAAAQTADLLAGLHVDVARMGETARGAAEALHSEQRAVAALAGHEPQGDYLGATEDIVTEVLARARTVLEGEPWT